MQGSGGWGGKGGIDKVWNLGMTSSQLAKQFNMHASQQYLQAAVRTFVVDPDILSKFSNIENLIFFRRSVRCQHQLKLYSIECD